MNETSRLAGFCADLSFSDLPPDLIDTAKTCILDFLGCVLGSVRMEEDSQRLARFIGGLGDRQEATVIGLGLRTSSRSAALAHGALAEMLELQDTYGPAGLHPASCVMPAALSLAEARHSSGKDLLTSIVTGYEAAARIGGAMGLSHLASGFMSTGTVGTFGAAMAAGKLLGLGREAMTGCLGIAGFLLPFSMSETLFGGYSIKPIHGGQAARMGIETALMAAEGFAGSERVLEGSLPREKGYLSLAAGHVDLDRITSGLGETYEMSKIAFKVFPCCGLTQTAVEATLNLVKSHHLDLDRVDRVTVRTFAEAAKNVGRNYPTAQSGLMACQFSMPYLVATAIKHGDLGLDQFTPECLHDPEVLDFSARVTVVEDPELTAVAKGSVRPTAVEIQTIDGGRLSARLDYRKGEARNPITEEELQAKFESLASQVLDGRAIERCTEMVRGLEAVKDVSDLVALCAGPRERH